MLIRTWEAGNAD